MNSGRKNVYSIILHNTREREANGTTNFCVFFPKFLPSLTPVLECGVCVIILPVYV